MKKKILFFIPSLEIGGGAERVASILSKNLSKCYDIVFLTFHDPKNKYYIDGKYYTFGENYNSWKKLLRPLKIYNLIKKISPDLMISFMDHVNLIAILVKFLFSLRIPLIISVRGNPQLAYDKTKSYIKYLIRFFYNFKGVNAIITVSKGIKKILIRNYKIDPKKLNTIYNGIELDEINQKKKENIDDLPELYKKDNSIRFISIGRLSKEKGHIYLLEAFNEVKNELSNSKLFIIGEGPLRKELENKINTWNLKEHVFLLGLKKNPYKYLNCASIFILSSLHEGFPMSILEAMACGLPIISTNCPTGPNEILNNGKYGLLVKTGDAGDLAKKMILLAKNEALRNKYSALSINRIKHFQNEKIISKWISLIESCLK
ncbi:MAG: glycosyltransferase [Promethearchaeota archaeon]